MKRLWLIRHAESEAQTGKELCFDSSLSRLGVLQAEQLKKIFDGIEMDVAYLSPLKRVRETYENSGINCKKVIFDSRIVEEMQEGAYSTILPYEELPAYGEADKSDAWNLDPAARAKSFLSELNKTGHEKILIISHSGFLSRLMLAIVAGSDSPPLSTANIYFGINNCGISSISLRNHENKNDIVLFWNDVSHVRHLLGYDPMK